MNDSNQLDKFKREIKNYPVLPKKEIFDLVQQYQDTGDIRLRNKIVTANMRYAFTVAKSWSDTKGWELDMCISNAMEALVLGVEKYQLNKKIDGENTSMVTFLKTHIDFSFLKYDLTEATQIKKTNHNNKTKPVMISTGATVTGMEGITLGDTLVASDDFMASDESDSNAIKSLLWNEIKNETKTTGIRNRIDNRAYDIIRGHFNEKEHKLILEEIGECYGVSKQCIRQKQEVVFKRLRNNKKLKEIYEHKLNYLK